MEVGGVEGGIPALDVAVLGDGGDVAVAGASDDGRAVLALAQRAVAREHGAQPGQVGVELARRAVALLAGEGVAVQVAVAADGLGQGDGVAFAVGLELSWDDGSGLVDGGSGGVVDVLPQGEAQGELIEEPGVV